MIERALCAMAIILLLLAPSFESLGVKTLWPDSSDDHSLTNPQPDESNEYYHASIKTNPPLQTLVPTGPLPLDQPFSLSLQRSVWYLDDASGHSERDLEFSLAEPDWVKLEVDEQTLVLSGTPPIEIAGSVVAISIVANLPAIGLSSTFTVEMSVSEVAPDQPSLPRAWWEWSWTDWPPSPLMIVAAVLFSVLVMVFGIATLRRRKLCTSLMEGRADRHSFFDTAHWIHEHSDLESVLNPPRTISRPWIPALHIQNTGSPIQHLDDSGSVSAGSPPDNKGAFGGLTYSPLFEFSYRNNLADRKEGSSRQSLDSLFAAQQQEYELEVNSPSGAPSPPPFPILD
eukprot:gb/GEZN01009518.1/.p1 GENE.gb/GEZN01009518.1/~~gb/GEZN01009518.1/.p1  ORF type:complete len:367 (+),score=38.15 gb/GEZN01009518.1/:78-1103(+)